jgi:hypothetical protein
MHFQRRTTYRFARLIAAVWCAIAIDGHCAESHAGVRFDTPGVLDLAEKETTSARVSDVRIEKLGDADAAAILAMPKPDSQHPPLAFSEDIYRCKSADVGCDRSHERALIAATGDVVKRDGKRLTIQPLAGVPIVFVDSKTASTSTADGDEEGHWYLGTLPGSGYHRVEVQFGHDAPGSYLVNPANGNVAFVHNGADIVVPSLGGSALITYNTETVDLSLRFAALDKTGPRIDLQCTGKPDDDKIAVEFKRWRDETAFGLSLFPKGESVNDTIALRIAHTSGGWSVFASDPQRLAASGFTCR